MSEWKDLATFPIPEWVDLNRVEAVIDGVGLSKPWNSIENKQAPGLKWRIVPKTYYPDEAGSLRKIYDDLGKRIETLMSASQPDAAERNRWITLLSEERSVVWAHMARYGAWSSE